jgi:hypothetical protein
MHIYDPSDSVKIINLLHAGVLNSSLRISTDFNLGHGVKLFSR